MALGLDGVREVTEDFTIGCTAAGQPTFTFTSRIEPVNADDTDPNPNNHARSAQLHGGVVEKF